MLKGRGSFALETLSRRGPASSSAAESLEADRRMRLVRECVAEVCANGGGGGGHH